MTHENNAVCSHCRHLFDITTGAIVPGWENAKFVSAGERACLNCTESSALIKELQGTPA